MLRLIVAILLALGAQAAFAHTLHALGVRHYALQIFRSSGCTGDDLTHVRTVG
jgi:H+/gluconate symporter-like permease